jgi:hypothetical protein
MQHVRIFSEPEFRKNLRREISKGCLDGKKKRLFTSFWAFVDPLYSFLFLTIFILCIDTFGERLSRGAYGVVSTVIDNASGVKYACKQVPVSETCFHNGNVSEVETLRHVSSPLLVKCVDAFIEDAQLFIVMEFCDKGDLHAFLTDMKEKGLQMSEEVCT